MSSENQGIGKNRVAGNYRNTNVGRHSEITSHIKIMNRLFKPDNIIWIKNVNTPTEDAYMNLPDNNFRLYFPEQHKTNAGSPQEGDIILLFQNIKRQKVFTHLVSPIDNLHAQKDETRERHPFYRNVKIVALTPPEELIVVSNTKWKVVNFQGIGQGNACKITNISSIGNNHEELIEDVWYRFNHFLR